MSETKKKSEKKCEVVSWQVDVVVNDPVVLVDTGDGLVQGFSPAALRRVLGGDRRVFIAGYLQGVSDMYHDRACLQQLAERLDSLLR